MNLDQTAPRDTLKSRVVYVCLQVMLHVLLPFILCILLVRAIKEPEHLRGIADRFGFSRIRQRGAVWIYAASLGETRAASPLIERLRSGGHSVLLTHLSPAGLEEGYRLFPNDSGIEHCYVPLDLFWAMQLFLRRARPAFGIVMEIEVWPAMLVEARRRGVPMIMANGNLLEKTIASKTGIRKNLLHFYREFEHIFTRTDEYKGRYLRVGVDPKKISVVGEMKYDQWIDPAHPAMGIALRKRWGISRVLMIASSVKDEEPLLLPMVTELLAADPNLGVVWVPRSPQRFDPVCDALTLAGHTPVRRSALGVAMAEVLPKSTRIIIGDSIGEMNAYYSIADLVFVGASLIDHGGHNIMEPMALAKPVIMGPSIYGIAFAAEPAAAAGAFENVADVHALQVRISALMADNTKLQFMSARAAAFATSQIGAADRTMAGLAFLIRR